jgi:hypothetical protein
MEGIRFKKSYAEPISMHVIDSGLRSEVYARAEGRLGIDAKDISECIFLTKYLGNYNITKIGDAFIFENEGYAVSLQRT